MRDNVDVLVHCTSTHYSKDTKSITEFTQVKTPIAEWKDTIVDNVLYKKLNPMQ